MYNTCLSGTSIGGDIYSLYNVGNGTGTPPKTSNLLRRYDFDNNGLDTNTVGTQYNLSLFNSPTYTTGKVPVVSGVVEGIPITYSDGVYASEKGTLLLGDISSGTWLQGLSIKALINNSTIPFIIGSNGYVLINPTNTSQTATSSYPLTVVGGDISVNGITIGVGAGGLNSNVAIGLQALQLMTRGNNTAVGYQAAQNATGQYTTAVGTAALQNVTGQFNSAFGISSLLNLTSGGSNVAIGHLAGAYILGGVTKAQTNSNSIFIGYAAYPLANGDTNEIVIGYNAVGNGSNTIVIGNSASISTQLFGNVGIGTNNPLANTTTRKALVVSDTTNNTTIRMEGSGSVVAEWATTGTTTVFGTRSNHQLNIFTNGTDKVIIDVNGYVGIGNLTPNAPLDVAGAVAIAGPGNYQMKVFDSTTSGKDVGGAIGLGGYYLTQSTTSNFGIIKGGKENANVGDNAGYLSFFTRLTGGSFIEKMRITSIGNLLIGTTSGTYLLTVNGDALINGIIFGLGGGGSNTNVAIGYNVLPTNTIGTGNVAIGYNAMNSTSTNSNNNIGIGYGALQTTVGSQNSVVGFGAMASVTSGSNNTVMGYHAGRYYGSSFSNSATNLQNSVMIGYNATQLNNSDTNEIVIGYNAVGNGSNTIVIGNSSITSIQLFGSLLLGTNTTNAAGILQTAGNIAPATNNTYTLGASSYQWSNIYTTNLNIGGQVLNSINTLSVSASSVTINLSLGNYFTLTLPSNATASFTFSNIPSNAQTINLQITTGTSSTVSFPSIVKQPAGSSYVPTTANGSIDILSFITMGNGNLYLVNSKNLQ